MRWFRMYGEMPDDPKIGTLNDAEFRTWVELLCLACREERDGTTSANRETINWLLRRNVTEPLHALLLKRLVHENANGFIAISNWDKRQKPSDSSAERVRKYRNKVQCNVTVTPAKRNGNGAEKSREEKKGADAPTPILPDWLDIGVWESYRDMRKRIRKPLTDYAEKLAIGKLDEWRKQGHNPSDIINNSVMNGYQGLIAPKGQKFQKPPQPQYTNRGMK